MINMEKIGDDKVRVYSYEDALTLTGHGKYNYGLLLTLTITLLSMAMDMFGFALVVSACTCDFNLDLTQKSILMSMSFLGPIIMSYPWGYLSDTQGRKKTLMIAIWGSFIMACLSAFSPNWIVLALLKLCSTSFCSNAQSATYTILGESCSLRVRNIYVVIITSVLCSCVGYNFVIAYFVLQHDYRYNLGYIDFTPWRMLALVLATPLAISGILLNFFHESPKFLAISGHEDQAVALLEDIYKKNGGVGEYPVKKILVNEDGTARDKDIPFCESLRDQTVPLFKPPLLWRTLQIYFLMAVTYSSNNGLAMWTPLLADYLSKELNTSNSTLSQGLCTMIGNTQSKSSTDTACSKLEAPVVIAVLSYNLTLSLINLVIYRMAARKKLMLLVFTSIACVASFLVGFLDYPIPALIAFMTIFTNSFCVGILFMYFVDIYPGKYRGMVSCLGVIVCRASSLAGINALGAFITTQCSYTFYAICAWNASGVLVAIFLPSDRKPK